MRLTTRLIATAVFAIFLMSAFDLRAEETAKLSPGADKTVDSSIAAVVNPDASLPFTPMPESSMAAAMPYSRGLNSYTPKVEVFLGYSYLRAVPTLAVGNRLVWMNGGSASIAYNINRHWGIVADVGDYTNSKIQFTGAYNATIDVDEANGGFLSYLFGPRLSFRHERLTPFVQALFGGVHASEVDIANCTFSCTLLPVQNSFALTAGGGLDIKVRRHLAIRIIQAEYLMTRFQNYDTGTTAMQNDMRLSSGIVFSFGGNPAPPLPPPSPLELSCSVNPPSVYMGETLAASGTALNLNPKKTVVYTWSVDGGTVTGVESTAKIDTTNLAPGTYTLKGHVSEGERPGENADCAAPYVVKPFAPPTVSCVANPSAVMSGDPSTITATGNSPQNRPLTYSYSSTSGSVSGSGTTATLSTVGSAVGAVTVTCAVVDDKNQTASGTTEVTVSVPPVVAKPTTSNLCSIQFDRDSRRPSRVDNDAKACLDEIALNLQQNTDATIAVVGNAAADERGGKQLAAQRAVNTKTYLVNEKGVDASRVTVYSGPQDGKTVSTTLIPAGATFDATGDIPVNRAH
jgi:outer membrane protein OmpA-like peptidoglycan-associated protein